jgi:hypothetical protein
MNASKQVSIVRVARRVISPGGIRCVLCKLYASDDEAPPGVESFEVRYNGDDGWRDEGRPENPLCALTRRKYVCDDCIEALKRMP